MNNAQEKIYNEEDIKSCIKPLSGNGFIRLFQNAGRRWLGVWYAFAESKPRLADWLYKIGFFLTFSVSVTLYQYIIMTFLPYAFKSFNNGPAGWPMIPIKAAGGRNFTVFGDGNGWGYFIASEIAVFTAQCINFPLQRNVTYKSHGNPWVQAAWYFAGWVLVSVGTSCVWGVCNAFLLHWGCPQAVSGLIKTLLTGCVSLIVFFFIFMVIFPDNAKIADRAAKKYGKLFAAGASAKKLQKAENRKNLWESRALASRAEQERRSAISLASARAIKYFAFKKRFGQARSLCVRLAESGAPETKLIKAQAERARCLDLKERAFVQAAEAAARVEKYTAES